MQILQSGQTAKRFLPGDTVAIVPFLPGLRVIAKTLLCAIMPASRALRRFPICRLFPSMPDILPKINVV